MIALSPLRRANKVRAHQPIRISFVMDSLSRAGTESQLLALIRELDRTTFVPSLVLLDGQDARSQALEPTDCEVHRLGVRKLLSRRAFAAAAELRRLWTRHRPDIVQTYFLDASYFALPIARLCGVPHRLRVRNNLGYWLTPKHRLLERLVRPLVHCTLTNCDSAAAQLRESGIRRVATLANGVDLTRFAPRRIHRVPAIACIANLRPVKNLDGLLRATAIVHKRHPDVRITIAGEGPERARLESLRATLGLAECVHLPGSRADIPGFLAAHPIAVLPSHSEGMSNALLESMAAGCAIVATDVGANADVLGDAGVIVPPRDDEALARGLMQLLDDPDHAQKLGHEARQRVEEHFSREAMRQRFEEFYHGLVAKV